MSAEKLKMAIDIAKTKLYFFSAVAGGVWFKLSLEATLYNAVMYFVFIASLAGVFKNLLLLGQYEKRLRDEE